MGGSNEIRQTGHHNPFIEKKFITLTSLKIQAYDYDCFIQP